MSMEYNVYVLEIQSTYPVDMNMFIWYNANKGFTRKSDYSSRSLYSLVLQTLNSTLFYTSFHFYFFESFILRPLLNIFDRNYDRTCSWNIWSCFKISWSQNFANEIEVRIIQKLMKQNASARTGIIRFWQLLLSHRLTHKHTHSFYTHVSSLFLIHTHTHKYAIDSWSFFSIVYIYETSKSLHFRCVYMWINDKKKIWQNWKR